MFLLLRQMKYLCILSNRGSRLKKGKGRALVIAPQVDTATTEALRYMARTKQRRAYLPYAFPAIGLVLGPSTSSSNLFFWDTVYTCIVQLQ